MIQFFENLKLDTFISPESVTRILGTLAIILLVWLLRRWMITLILRNATDPKQNYMIQRNTAYLATFVALIVIGMIWFENARQIATYLGLVSAGIAVALKDPLVNLFGWMYILWQRPFTVGDRIQIGEQAGDVIDITLFQFVLMEIRNWVDADQSTGRIIHVPNGRIFLESLANFTEEFDYIWNEIDFTFTFESDWQKTKRLLLKIAEQYSAPPEETTEEIQNVKSQKYYYFYNHLTPTVYTSVQDSGVRLTIRYLCRSRNRRGSEQAIAEAVLREIQPHDDINLAYTTYRNIVNLQANTKNEPDN